MVLIVKSKKMNGVKVKDGEVIERRRAAANELNCVVPKPSDLSMTTVTPCGAATTTKRSMMKNCSSSNTIYSCVLVQYKSKSILILRLLLHYI